MEIRPNLLVTEFNKSLTIFKIYSLRLSNCQKNVLMKIVASVWPTFRSFEALDGIPLLFTRWTLKVF